MSAIPLSWFLAVSALLFATGAFGVMARRHAVGVLMGVELMLNAANLNFLAFWRYLAPGSLEGQVFVIIVITAAAAEVALGLAIVLHVYRKFDTVDVDHINLMKG